MGSAPGRRRRGRARRDARRPGAPHPAERSTLGAHRPAAAAQRRARRFARRAGLRRRRSRSTASSSTAPSSAASSPSRGYGFAGESDAELLLRAYQHWDKEVVKHLRGAFAFALWDARKERLLLARDRFGQKPLYLAESGGTLYFASEMKALVRAPGVKTRSTSTRSATISRSAMCAARARWSPACASSRRAPTRSGSSARCARRATGRRPTAQPRDRARRGGDAVDGFIERLDEAVRLHMDGARPVGALLSGGYDSAAIVALMKRHATRSTTFSAGFADDKRQRARRRPARSPSTSAPRTTRSCCSARDVLAGLPQLVASRDAPFCRPADVALHLLARQAARHVKVALSGDGGDEILGGYRRHTFLRGFAPTAASGRTACSSFRWRDPSDAAAETSEIEPLRRILYYEQTGWLADNLLERTDRMTMAASLELRTPFLDHRAGRVRLGAARRGARARPVDEVDPAQGRRAAAHRRRLKPRKARLPHRRSRDLLRGEMRELLADHLRGAGLPDARLLRRRGARPHARRAPRRPSATTKRPCGRY